MERLLARLERTFGRFAIPNLTNYIVAGMAVTFGLAYARRDFLAWLTLDLDAVKQGQVWRLVSYLFIPRDMSFFFILTVMFTLFVGRSLESEWGTFKFNVYYLVGMIGTTVGALIVGHGVGNDWINMSLLFALATLFPDYEIMMLILPIKVKWLGLLSFLFLLYSAVTGDWATRAAIVCAMSNYLLFFAGHCQTELRDRNRAVRQTARRASFKDAPAPTVGRACAICGARQEDGADIRVCSCEKCGRPRSLCLEHARNH